MIYIRDIQKEKARRTVPGVSGRAFRSEKENIWKNWTFIGAPKREHKCMEFYAVWRTRAISTSQSMRCRNQSDLRRPPKNDDMQNTIRRKHLTSDEATNMTLPLLAHLVQISFFIEIIFCATSIGGQPPQIGLIVPMRFRQRRCCTGNFVNAVPGLQMPRRIKTQVTSVATTISMHTCLCWCLLCLPSGTLISQPFLSNTFPLNNPRHGSTEEERNVTCR